MLPGRGGEGRKTGLLRRAAEGPREGAARLGTGARLQNYFRRLHKDGKSRARADRRALVA